MQPLTRQILIENRRAFRRRRCALAARLAGDRMMAALNRLESLLASKEFDPNQPRAPAGSPDGEQWAAQEDGLAVEIPSLSIASSGGRKLAAICEEQFGRDTFSMPNGWHAILL